jgi:hypothetical protein
MHGIKESGKSSQSEARLWSRLSCDNIVRVLKLKRINVENWIVKMLNGLNLISIGLQDWLLLC